MAASVASATPAPTVERPADRTADRRVSRDHGGREASREHPARGSRHRTPLRRPRRARAARRRHPRRRGSSRSSARTAPASRRSSRFSRARSRRARAASSRAPPPRVGWVPQRPAQYGRLSARENLELFARLEGLPDPAAAATSMLETVVELPDDDRPAARLSLGNQQRLNLGVALLADPDVLLLDEPTGGARPQPAAAGSGRSPRRARPRRRRRLRHAEPRGARHASRIASSCCAAASSSSTAPTRRTTRHRRRTSSHEAVRAARQGSARAPPLARAARRARSLSARGRRHGRPRRALRRRPARVALVDEDGLPAVLDVGGQRFDVEQIFDQAAEDVELVRLDQRRRPSRTARDGRGARRDRDPGGLRATCAAWYSSPKSCCARRNRASRTAYVSGCQALVYRLNLELQQAYIEPTSSTSTCSSRAAAAASSARSST